MFKRAKILALPLVLAAVLALLLFPGCGEKEAGPGETAAEGLTIQELQQVVADSVAEVKNATSYEFSLEMDMNVEIIGGSEAGKMALEMKSSGAADMAANEMKMDMDVSMDLDIPGMDEGSQSLSVEIYMLADWIYMKMGVEGLGEQWIKTSVTESVKEAYDLDILDQQLAPLESLGEIQFVKYETVDGSPCYVIKIVPDMEAMRNWLGEQGMLSMTTGWNPADWDLIDDIFKELSCSVWVAKDSKLIKKMKMVMDMEMTAEQAGASASDFDKMSIDVDLDMSLKDYNEPVSIELPDEAEDATEM